MKLLQNAGHWSHKQKADPLINDKEEILWEKGLLRMYIAVQTISRYDGGVEWDIFLLYKVVVNTSSCKSISLSDYTM